MEAHELPPRCRCGTRIHPRMAMCDECFRSPKGPPLPPAQYNSRPDRDTRHAMEGWDGNSRHRYGVTPRDD